MKAKGKRAVIFLGFISFSFLCGCCILDSPPIADFRWSPVDPVAYETISFTDMSIDRGGPLSGGGTIVEWIWDLGDSNTSRAQNPRYCYSRSGIYQVRLTVVDNCGNRATTVRDVRVRPSVGGEWRGLITDLYRRTYQISLVLSHSSTGGITGTAFVDIYACPIISASLAGDEFRVSFVYPGSGSQWLFVGSYDENNQRITGRALNMDWGGRQFGDFELRRTTPPLCRSLEEVPQQ